MTGRRPLESAAEWWGLKPTGRVPVELSEAEEAALFRTGAARQRENWDDGLHPGSGLKRGDYNGLLGGHILGALDEGGFAKLQGRKATKGIRSATEGDVDGVEVKGTPWVNGSLILRPGKFNPDRVHALMVGQGPVLWLAGYRLAREVMLNEYWNETSKTRPPAWFVPQSALHRGRVPEHLFDKPLRVPGPFMPEGDDADSIAAACAVWSAATVLGENGDQIAPFVPAMRALRLDMMRLERAEGAT